MATAKTTTTTTSASTTPSPDDAEPSVGVHRQPWGAVAGYLAVAAGIAGVGLERPWPEEGESPASFLAEHGDAVAGQSAVFALGSVLYLWFAVLLGHRLRRAGASGADVVPMAAAASTAVSVVGVAPQAALSMADPATVSTETFELMADLGFVVLGLANAPLAGLLAAVAVGSLRHGALPRWLAGASAVVAVGVATLTVGFLFTAGPLAPQGWLTFVLYLLPVAWMVAVATVMARGPRRLPGA